MNHRKTILGINAAVSVLLLAVVVAVALVIRPPAPPGIAEFAPRASKPITHAPAAQAGQFGGAGSCAAGVACAGGSRRSRLLPSAQPVPPAAVGVPSELQCYVWPDGAVTQTFDPQSPPCVSSWPDASAGNGGATSFGVSRSDIRIGLSLENPQDPIVAALLAFFNEHFELYGRRLVTVNDTVASSPGDPTAQHAQAVQDAQDKAFAAIYDDNATLDDVPYLQALAREHILGVNAFSTNVSSSQLAALAPYAWSYYPTADVEQVNLGEFVCRALAGHPAIHANDAALKVATRSFAILYPKAYYGTAVDVRPLQARLAACGITADSVAYDGFIQSGGSRGLGAESAPNSADLQTMLRLKQQGITTVLLAGSTLDTPNALNGASQASYHPEWLTVTTGDYVPSNYLEAPSDETASLMGLAYWNKELARAQDVGFEALRAQDSNSSDAAGWYNFYESIYKSLLLISSGIQAAGPDLTPGAFGQALTGLAFPNPGVDGPPTYQARVGFSASDPAMVDDYGLYYWSPTAVDYDTAAAGQHTGSYCYVDSGARWRIGDWPSSDPGFFAGATAC